DAIRRELGRRPLIVRELDGQRLVTTPEILAEEQRLIAFARDGRGTERSLGGFGRAFKRQWFSDEQKRAVRHVWESPDAVILRRGAAGGGKTTLLKEAGEGMEANGIRAVALAPSADASRGVLREEAKIAEADTIARFLQDRQYQERARGGVILIDEASMVG